MKSVKQKTNHKAVIAYETRKNDATQSRNMYADYMSDLPYDFALFRAYKIV